MKRGERTALRAVRGEKPRSGVVKRANPGLIALIC
jgi:hypothetical protein